MPWWSIVLVALIMGFIASAVVGGELRTRVIAFLSVGGGIAALLILLDVTRWFESPSIGYVGIALMSVATAAVVLFTSTGFHNRRALLAVGIVVVLTIALSWPFQFLFYYLNSAWTVLLVIAIMAGLG